MVESQKIDAKSIIQQVRQELALQNFQELLAKAIPRCFSKCVLKVGVRLDNTEQTCLQRCAERYSETYGLVGQSYLQRIRRESADAGGEDLDFEDM